MQIYFAAESPYMKRKLEDPDLKDLKLDNVDCHILKDIMNFIYRDEISNFDEKADKILYHADKVVNLSFIQNSVPNFYYFSHQFGMNRLKVMCEKSMYENLNISNALETIKKAKECNASRLKKGVINFIRAWVDFWNFSRIYRMKRFSVLETRKL